MSRFSSDDYEEMFPNQGELWHANVERAIMGKHGQRDLRTLEAALLEMPSKRLVEGRLATKDGEVCAVGAFALKRRTEKGEDRDAVLAELEKAMTVYCETCNHAEAEHHGGTCGGCARAAERYIARGDGVPSFFACTAFKDGYTEDYGEETATAGKRAGMTFTLAWRIGQLNDEDFGHMTPEDRYDAVLNWVREHITEAVAA